MFRWFLAGLAGWILTSVATAQMPVVEVRIDSNVQGVKSIIFLLEGKFYSMIDDNGEIVEFDAEKKTFSLIDPALRIQTQIDAVEIKKRVEQLRQQILSDPKIQTDAFRYFAFKPTFVSEFDAASGRLALQSNWIDYEIKTVPFADPAAGRYYDLCDWICYLNFRLNPRATQMLIRLEVNRFLREKQRFAVNVSESLYPRGKQRFARPEQVSSSHELVRRLGDTDRRRIEQAQEFQRTFLYVPFDEYQRRFAEKMAK